MENHNTQENENTAPLVPSGASAALQELNEHLKEMGMLEMALVNPKDLIPQRVNARYMTVDTFEQLVQNVKSTGALESQPLVYQDEELKEQGKYEIISGHHRTEAAKAAGIPLILVMVIRDISRESLVSKQLAHNAITGTDDKGILKELFDSITDINLKMASGLSSEIDKVTYDSLNFKIGIFKTFIIGFAPNSIEDYDKAVEELYANAAIRPTDEVRIASMDIYDDFIQSIIRIKKQENIKNNAVALARLIELVKPILDQKDVDAAEAKQLKEKED